MNAGRLKDPITIQKINPLAPTLADGTVDRSDPANWIAHCARRSEVIETAGREKLQGRQIVAGISHLIRLRRDALTEAITSEMHVIYNGQTLQIAGVARIDRTVELSCESKV